jgi:hypothetical protein
MIFLQIILTKHLNNSISIHYGLVILRPGSSFLPVRSGGLVTFPAEGKSILQADFVPLGTIYR